MANTLSAKKRHRQNLDARARNRWRLRAMRDAIKQFFDRAQHGTDKEAQELLRAACQMIDKTAGKGVIHKNQAARRKSRLVRRMKLKQAA